MAVRAWVHAAHGRARELTERPTGHQPRWAYYVSPQFVDAAGGFYQVSLATACSARKVNPHIREFSTELDRRLKLVA